MVGFVGGQQEQRSVSEYTLLQTPVPDTKDAAAVASVAVTAAGDGTALARAVITCPPHTKGDLHQCIDAAARLVLGTYPRACTRATLLSARIVCAHTHAALLDTRQWQSRDTGALAGVPVSVVPAQRVFCLEDQRQVAVVAVDMTFASGPQGSDDCDGDDAAGSDSD